METTLVYIKKEDFAKSNADKHDRIDRLWDQEEANSILAEIQGNQTQQWCLRQKRDLRKALENSMT